MPDGQQYQATTCGRPVRDNSSTLYGVTWAFLAVVTIFVVLRLLSRWRGLNGSGYSWDDWVALFAFVLVVPLNVSLDQATRSGLATDLYTNTVGNIEDVLRWLYIAEILYISIVMATKIAVVLLYLRIWTAESVTKAFRLSCWISIGVLAMTALAFDFAAIFQCSPVSYVWNRVTGGTGSCFEVAPMLYAFGALNILYDVAVFMLPMYSLLRLNIALHKKLGVSAVFFIGLVVTIAAILRIQYVARATGTMDATWDYQYTGLWAIIEANLSIICVCAPAVVGLIQRWSSGKLEAAEGGYANGSVAVQRMFGRRKDGDSDIDGPGITATEMTQQDEPADLESVLRKGQFDGQSGTSKIGEIDMKSIGSNSTSDILELHRPGSSKKMASLFPGNDNAEATALVFRPQPGKHNKVEISHDPPSQPAEARLAYRDENDVYHEVTITDIPHGRFPMHSKGTARPSGLGALTEAENSDESRSPPRSRLDSGQSDANQSKSDSVRSSDPQGQGVALPGPHPAQASPTQSPPVSQLGLGYQSLNGSFVGGANGMNSKRNSQFVGAPRQSMARSISLASGTLEAIEVAGKTPSPPTSHAAQSITTQTDATSLDEMPLSAAAPIKRQEVVYTPRSNTPQGMHLRSPSKSTQVDEGSLSPPPRASVDGGTQVTQTTSRSPSNRWEWPSEPESRGASPVPAMSPEPFMRAPSPLKPPSPPPLQSNLPQVAREREESQPPAPNRPNRYRDSSLQVGTPMVDPYEFDGHSPFPMSPPPGPPDQYADEPVTAHTRSVSRAMSPPLPTTNEPSSSNPPSNEVMFSPRGRSPPRPQSNKYNAPRSESSAALNSPFLPTRDMGTETDPETDNPRTPSIPRGAEDWHLSRTVSQLDMPIDSANLDSRMMSRSPLRDHSTFDGERRMSGEILAPTTFNADHSRPGSRFRSQSPEIEIDVNAANANQEYPQPSADMGVQAGGSHMQGRTPPTMSMPLPAVDIDQSHSPRTASSQAVPMMANFRSPGRSPSPTTMMAGIQSPFTDDVRPPLSKAGSDQYIPRPPSPTAMMSGIVPDNYHESRRGSTMSPVRSPSPARSPSIPRSIAPMFSPRDINSPRYESADAGTSPMSNGSDDDVMGTGIFSPPDIDHPRTHSADAGTSPMSDYKEEDSEPDVTAASALPVRDIEQQRSNSADRGTSPMSDWNDDESPVESPAPASPDVMAPRSMPAADRGTSPMKTDSPQSPLPGLASRSASVTTAGSRTNDDDPLPVRDIDQARSSSADRGTSPMSDWADNEDAPSPQYDSQAKRRSGDFARRPVLSPIQNMRRLSRPSQPSSDENTPAHTQLPFANAAGRRAIPQPPPFERKSSQVALPMGMSDIEGTWTPDERRSPNLDRVDETDDGAMSPYDMPSVVHSAVIPDERGRTLPVYGAIMSPDVDGGRMPSSEMNEAQFDQHFEEQYDERERFRERANSNDFYPAGMPMFPDEFDNNSDNGSDDNSPEYSPVRGIYDESEEDDDEEEWPPRHDYDIPHIPSPLLAQLAGAASPDIFESRSPSRSRSVSVSRSRSVSVSRSRSISVSRSRSPSQSRSRSVSRSPSASRSRSESPDADRREHTRSPSVTRREFTRMGEVVATDAFENNMSPVFSPVLRNSSAVADQVKSPGRMPWQLDDSRLQSPAGNATGMRSPDVANPDPVHPEALLQELHRRKSVIMDDEGTDMPDMDPPRPYSAELAALDMNSSTPIEPSSARLQRAFENASPDVSAQDYPSHAQSPDVYGAQLAFMNMNGSQSVSRQASRPSSARVQERQWQSMSPQYDPTSWDEGPTSPPLPVVSPGLDDNNNSTPTTPGDESPARSPVRSPSWSPPQSPGEGIRLSRTDSWDNGRPQESHTPGSDFMPTRPVSQLDLPTVSDMDSDSPAVGTNFDEPTEPSSAVSVNRRESTVPSSAVVVSSPDLPRRSFEPVTDTTDNETRPSSRLVPTESTPGEAQAALRSLWMRAESRQSTRVPMSRETSRAPSFEDTTEDGILEMPSNREANTESWYNPSGVLPRVASPTPGDDKNDADREHSASQRAASPVADLASVDPYVESFADTEEATRSPSPDRMPSSEFAPTFDMMQSQSEAPTDDPVADALMSQAESADESHDVVATSLAIEKPAMVEMATSPMVENPRMSMRAASPSSEKPSSTETEEKPATAEMATSPMVENRHLSMATSERSAQQDQVEAKPSSESSDPLADTLLSLVPAGEKHEDEDSVGFVGSTVNVPPSQLAKKVSVNAEYDPFSYASVEEKTQSKESPKHVDEPTLGSLVGSSKPTSPAEPSTAESPARTVSQRNLPTISAVTAEETQAQGPPTPRVANVEVMSPKASPSKAARSDSHDSRHGSLLSDSSGPSDETTMPSTPPDDEAASPFTPGLKELFATESPQVSVAGETKITSDTEKLRRPEPPTRTASQLAYPEED